MLQEKNASHRFKSSCLQGVFHELLSFLHTLRMTFHAKPLLSTVALSFLFWCCIQCRTPAFGRLQESFFNKLADGAARRHGFLLLYGEKSCGATTQSSLSASETSAMSFAIAGGSIGTRPLAIICCASGTASSSLSSSAHSGLAG